MTEHNDRNRQQEQQHLDIHHPLDEQLPLSNKSSSSTNTGETVSYH